MNLILKSLLCHNSLINNDRVYSNIFIGNEEIKNCFFQRINIFSGSGGVIYSNQNNYQLNISFCSFIYCQSSFYGGAIYLNYLNLHFFIYSTCAFSCECPSTGQFSFSISSNSYFQSYNLTSIIKCSPNESTNGDNPIRMDNGNQYFYESNSSLNNCLSYSSSIGIINPSFFLCKFSTISLNKAISSTTIQLNGGNNLRSINYSNIISNKSPNGAIFEVFSSGIYFIVDCIIFNNSKKLFSNNNIVINSFIFHNINDIGIILSNDNFITITSIYNLKNFLTHHCSVNLDSSKKILFLFPKVFKIFLLFILLN